MIFLKANNLEILKGVGTMKNKHNKEKNVSSSSNDQLTGLDNKRLTKKEPSHNEGTLHGQMMRSYKTNQRSYTI